CDAEGRITYFNWTAVEVWGRTPELNNDAERFCGSFKLYHTYGTPMSHDQCWMALAIENKIGGLGCDGQRRNIGGRRSAVACRVDDRWSARACHLSLPEGREISAMTNDKRNTENGKFKRLKIFLPAEHRLERHRCSTRESRP